MLRAFQESQIEVYKQVTLWVDQKNSQYQNEDVVNTAVSYFYKVQGEDLSMDYFIY